MTEKAIPEYLYHGTSALLRDPIIKNGLQPRGTRSGNWKHTVGSNKQAVYLTTAYPLHFAASASSSENGLLIVEVRASVLSGEQMAPDEDFLEQVSRRDPQFAHIGSSMEARTKWFRRRALSHYASYWEMSLHSLGTCAHYGSIPASIITRSAVVPVRSPLVRASDPTITLVNYNIMGGFYRQLVRHIFGDPIDESDLGLMSGRAAYINNLPREGIVVTEHSTHVLEEAIQ